MPSWITPTGGETLEDAGFSSGAALSALDLMLSQSGLPKALIRDRLALKAATACVAFSGRPERAGDLRDAVHLLRPGDLPGPAGAVYLRWRRAVERPISARALQRVFPEWDPARLSHWLDGGRGTPVARMANVLETVLTEAPRAEAPALILAEVALARTLGWDHMVPLLTNGLTRADLRKSGEDLRRACHRAVTVSARDAMRLATDLTRQTARLTAAGPRLRAKGADAAVGMFLSRDAVAPSALPMPDRAARRLCDRLVGLGVVRELTGRDTFRLYGV